MAFQNVGDLDRTVRIWLGILLLAADVFLIPSGSGYSAIVAFLGVMVMVSGLMGFCILYVPFGFSTKRPEPVGRACCGPAQQ